MKKLRTLFSLVFVATCFLSTQAMAITDACESFASSSGVGTFGGLYWALRCAASSVVDFWEIIR